jgi:hypothetical protein
VLDLVELLLGGFDLCIQTADLFVVLVDEGLGRPPKGVKLGAVEEEPSERVRGHQRIDPILSFDRRMRECDSAFAKAEEGTHSQLCRR